MSEHSDKEINLLEQFIEGCRKCNLNYPLECGDCIEDFLDKIKKGDGKNNKLDNINKNIKRKN